AAGRVVVLLAVVGGEQGAAELQFQRIEQVDPRVAGGVAALPDHVGVDGDVAVAEVGHGSVAAQSLGQHRCVMTAGAPGKRGRQEGIDRAGGAFAGNGGSAGGRVRI